MVTHIEVNDYKCLRRVSVGCGAFNVLVGPNASGKSTLVDVLGLLQDALNHRDGLTGAVRRRAGRLAELTWRTEGESFSVGIHTKRRHASVSPESAEWLTYALCPALGDDGALSVGGEVLVAGNRGAWRPPAWDILKFLAKKRSKSVRFDPAGVKVPGRRVLLARAGGTSAVFRPTTGRTWRLGPRPDHLALSSVLEDPEQFASALWLRQLLRERVHVLELSPAAMRRPCPPDAPSSPVENGLNLPLLVRQIEGTERFAWWVAHLRTVLTGIETVSVVEQEFDRHLYLRVAYTNGLKVPSWLLSDGTLRFLALTLLPYLPLEERIYIIEEPENGIHPRAIEAVMQSLSSVYDGQVFLVTHSPLIVGLTDPENLLCFSQDEEGATQIVRGSEHPDLLAWREGMPLGDLFAAGVLG